MALPPDYTAILNDLNRDVLRFRPLDTLQFCANWFQRRLEDDRKRAFAGGANSSSGTAANGAALADQAAAAASSDANARAPEAPLSPSARANPTSLADANPFGNSSFSFQPGLGAAAAAAAAAPSATASSVGSLGGVGGPAPDFASPPSTASSVSSSTPFAPPANYNLGRRTSVSAECVGGTGSAGGLGGAMGGLGVGGRSGSLGGAGGADASSGAAELPKTVIPKSESQMARIKASIGDNLLFRNLDEEQERDVLLAMKEVRCGPGEVVIRQGDQGDYFYTVESGTLDVYVRSGGADASQRASVSTADSSAGSEEGGKAGSLGGTTATAATANLGEKKVSYGPASSFGELALLYAQPRAATIVSTSACILWALDRVTFRSILMQTNSRKRQLFESFLSRVSLFEHLKDAERAKIADVLELRNYAQGERVIEQGERGTEFFIIVEGRAEVRKRREEDGVEESVGRLSKGDYFGELALLNNAPRAASIVAMPPSTDASASTSSSTAVALRVATLSEQAFQRLVGPLAAIMSRHAEERYGPKSAIYGYGGGGGGHAHPAATTAATGAGGGGGAGFDAARVGTTTATLDGDVSMVAPDASSSSSSSLGAPRAAAAAGGPNVPSPASAVVGGGVDPTTRAAPGVGTWVGGMGASPFQ